MDYYMDYGNFYKRLESWYKQHGSLIIAYDFDDTVYNSYKNTSARYDAVISLLRRWKKYSTLICYTAREVHELDFVKEYLEQNNIPYDYINKDFDGKEIVGRKIYYNILIDDKCGLETPFMALQELIQKIENNRLTL